MSISRDVTFVEVKEQLNHHNILCVEMKLVKIVSNSKVLSTKIEIE
jgi:hypothetical protein